MAFELLLILALVIVNGCSPPLKIAIVGVDKMTLQKLSEKSERRAAAVETLRRSERFFATVQIGITVDRRDHRRDRRLLRSRKGSSRCCSPCRRSSRTTPAA